MGDIQTDKLSYINIDIPWKRCYVRAQAYTMTKKGMQPVRGVVMTLIGKENNDQEQYYGYTKRITNKNGIACIPAWCDSNVVLQSSKMPYNADGSRRVIPLNPDDTVLEKLSPGLEASVIEGNDSSSFQFTTKVISQAGPIFSNDEMNKCLDLSDTLMAFRFYFNETKIKLKQLDDFGSRPPGHPLSWYTTDASKPNQEPTKCFIKISAGYRLESKVPWVYVQSFTPDCKSRYGYSRKEVTFDWEGSFGGYHHFAVGSVCVEYRCSEIGKETFLVSTAFNGDNCLRPLAYFLEFTPPRHFTRNDFFNGARFYVPADVSDGRHSGLYSGRGKIAEERCKASTVYAFQTTTAFPPC